MKIRMSGIGALVAVCAAQSAAQGIEQYAAFETKCYAEVIEVPAASGRVRVSFTYQNHPVDEGLVTARFDYKAHGAPQGPPIDVSYTSLNFAPTFVCSRAATTDTVYVGGWNADAEVSIVQRWTFGQFTLGANTNPVTGGSSSVLTLPAVERTTVAVLPGLSVISAACNPFGPSDTLLLLVRRPSGLSLEALDVEHLDLTPVLTEADESAVALQRSLAVGLSRTDGFICYALPRFEWHTIYGPADATDILIYQDVDLDGDEEMCIGADYSDLLIYSGTWDYDFAAPP